MPSKKKRLSRVPITLADEQERFLIYTFDDMHEVQELTAAAERDGRKLDPREYPHVVWLGLRRGDPALTLEDVKNLVDMGNLDYYIECVNEAMGVGVFPGLFPTQAATGEPAPAPRVNGSAIDTGRNYSPGVESTLLSVSGSSGNSQPEN